MAIILKNFDSDILPSGLTTNYEYHKKLNERYLLTIQWEWVSHGDCIFNAFVVDGEDLSLNPTVINIVEDRLEELLYSLSVSLSGIGITDFCLPHEIRFDFESLPKNWFTQVQELAVNYNISAEDSIQLYEQGLNPKEKSLILPQLQIFVETLQNYLRLMPPLYSSLEITYSPLLNLMNEKIIAAVAKLKEPGDCSDYEVADQWIGNQFGISLHDFPNIVALGINPINGSPLGNEKVDWREEPSFDAQQAQTMTHAQKKPIWLRSK